MTISKGLLDELLKGCERPEDLLGDAGLMKELKIKLMERMLGAELTAHLGYEEGKDAPPDQANRRNGTSAKRLKGQDGEFPIAVPRDRDGSFEPELVKKGQTRIDGMDDKIIERACCSSLFTATKRMVGREAASAIASASAASFFWRFTKGFT